MTDVPETHPRYESLRLRDAVVAGVERGVTSVHGLIAHGRGEAFDYLLGERTHDFAHEASAAAAAMLASAQRPVVSVNGNAAALAADGLVALAEALSCPLEVNLFHKSRERERAIEALLVESGAARVLLPDPGTFLEGIDSNRRYVHPEGIHRADAVFVPLEDGDRCRILRAAGKEVVTVDLNPLSRTAKLASISIIDNVVRAMPLLVDAVSAAASGPHGSRRLLEKYDNGRILEAAERCMRNR
ncbi:MAG: phosphopantothenate/pantothenate synthetase [Gemmatimonadetes bacterium]|nr:phosphopantothenate/pantothenate synthetase [Gemmatimonadota bacterium]